MQRQWSKILIGMISIVAVVVVLIVSWILGKISSFIDLLLVFLHTSLVNVLSQRSVITEPSATGQVLYLPCFLSPLSLIVITQCHGISASILEIDVPLAVTIDWMWCSNDGRFKGYIADVKSVDA